MSSACLDVWVYIDMMCECVGMYVCMHFHSFMVRTCLQPHTHTHTHMHTHTHTHRKRTRAGNYTNYNQLISYYLVL